MHLEASEHLRAGGGGPHPLTLPSPRVFPTGVVVPDKVWRPDGYEPASVTTGVNAHMRCPAVSAARTMGAFTQCEGWT